MRKLIGYPIFFISSLLLLWSMFVSVQTFWHIWGVWVGVLSLIVAPVTLFLHSFLFIYFKGDWTDLITNIVLVALVFISDKMLKVKYKITKPKELHITENNLPQIEQYDAIKSVLSIPFVYYGVIFGAGVTLIIGVILIFLIYYMESSATDRYHPYILLAIGIGAFYGIVGSISAIYRSFTRKPDQVIGFLLKDHESKIYKLTKEVAKRVNARMPEHIIVTFEPDFHVQQAYSKLITGEIIKGNTLTIGYPFLKYLSVTEIKGVVAHEMAHFTGKDTVFSTKVAPAYRSLKLWISGLVDIGKGKNSSVWYILPNLLPMFLAKAVFNWYTKNLSRVDRVREARADMIGSICYGTNSFSNALKKVKQIGYLFGQVSDRDQFTFASEGKKVTNYFEYFDETYMHDQKMKMHLDDIIKSDKITSEFDTHYSFEERVAYLPDDNAVDYDTSERLLSKSEASDYESKLSDIYSSYVANIVEVYKAMQKQLGEEEAKQTQEELNRKRYENDNNVLPKCPKCGREYSKSR